MSVISVRIDKRIKEILERAGVNISYEVKKFLEDLAWQIEVKSRINRLDKILSKVPPAEKGFSSKSVREDREGS